MHLVSALFPLASEAGSVILMVAGVSQQVVSIVTPLLGGIGCGWLLRPHCSICWDPFVTFAFYAFAHAFIALQAPCYIKICYIKYLFC